MSDINENEFAELLLACQEISTLFSEGVVYIGGIAVYLHSFNSKKVKEFVEFTHDADFYISLADMSDLRDIEEVVANRRLNKHQLVKRGFEFDIYTERRSALIVPYDQVISYSVMFDNMRVASLEHLLVLKLEAYRDRCGSRKGEKDSKDIIRIGLLTESLKTKFDIDLITPYLNEEHINLLSRVSRGPEFLSMTRGNAKEAKNCRDTFSRFVKRII